MSDREEASGAAEREYETALGQAEPGAGSGGGVSGIQLNGVMGGDASPGTLELGEARAQEVGQQLPSANPFHSERVKAEVELIRTRPLSLDDDARRVTKEYDEAALGDSVGILYQEPDYAFSARDSGAVRDAPRVARVEPSPGDQGVISGVEEHLSAVSARGNVDVPKGPVGFEASEQRAGPRGIDAATVGEEDARELIPADDRLERMETLLFQVIEENRNLKRRLDQQVESRSHSSYHSGVATADQAFSPATFGPRVDTSVQQFISADFPGQGRMMVPDFRGLGNRWDGILPGESAFWEGAKQDVRTHGGVPGFASRVFGVSPEVPKAPSLPLPLPPIPARAVSPEPEPPQTMRQFADSLRKAEASQGPPGFSTPRGGMGSGQAFDSQGYPLSPGGTVIRPPPLPIAAAPTASRSYAGAPGIESSGQRNPGGFEHGLRPEEPAKYITELPKLASADLATSAIVCGNWLAQVRQMLVGLSPSAGVWWQGVEGPVNVAYQRWLVADPLGRLAVDPASVKGEYDEYLYGRVESRAVTLLLAAIPANVRDDVVTNRWLSTTAILFRIFCLFQPGGSSERAHLLAQLVNPDVCKSFPECIKVLRRWNQSLQRASEIHATLPDPSLLLRGVDAATGGLLASNQMVGFRVNSFRHRLGIDYNPTVASVLQLVKLIQAEAEASSIMSEGNQDKRARAAAAAAPSATSPAPGRDPPTGKSAPVLPPPPPPVVNAVSGAGNESKGRGKGKGAEGDKPPCHKFTDATGCRFGDSCMFKHDRAKAKKDGRCLACGQEGHFRSDCPLVSPENRVPAGDSSPEAKAPQGKAGLAKPKGKAKAGAQAKGITEEVDPKASSASGAGGPASSASPIANQEALVAEATKLLKGVALRAVSVSEGEGPDWSWVRSALASASNPEYCLIDSGATNALRPAEAEELRAGKVIRVDLASGTTELRINEFGTLLHGGQCQVILPASYLVDLGYSISWKRKGCTVKHPKQGKLQVIVVKGCPLIPREVGLGLLQAYEDRKAGKPVLSKAEVEDLGSGLDARGARRWLKERVQLRSEVGLSEVDQLVFLRATFPQVPLKSLARACAVPLSPDHADWAELPWNRRLRRTIDRAAEGPVLVALSPFFNTWKGFGRVLSVANSEKGIGCRLVFQALMRWARSGVIGGLVKGAEGFEGMTEGIRELDEDGLLHMLRFFLVYAVSQAVRDTCWDTGDQTPEGLSVGSPGVDPEPSFKELIGEGNSELGCPEGSDGLGPNGIFVAFEPVAVRLNGEVIGISESMLKVYPLNEARFDQGCFGAPGVYGTRLVTSSWFLYETIHEVRADHHMRNALEVIQEQAVDFSLTEVGWVGNLLHLVQKAWLMWKWEQERHAEVKERRLILKKLTEEEAYKRHLERDHVPYRKGCPICIQAQGRQRAHWRSGFPDMHSLSVDLAGPFVSGQSWDVEASGRDRGRGYKYFLACAYAVPTKYSPAAVLEDETAEYAPSECGELLQLPPEDEGTSSPDKALDEDGFGDLWDLPAVGLHAVTHRVKGKRPESGPEELGPVGLSVSDPPAEPGGDSLPRTLEGGHRTLFFGVPLRTKRGKEVLPQVQGVINRLEAAGFPVQRFHADRAKELRTTALVSWLKHQAIHPTWTAGESPAGNRAELAVQNLKGFVRKLLYIADLPKSYWPLALHHASARNWFDFCETAGVVLPSLLPFGLKVHARKRVKTGFAAQWEARTMPGTYLGQAPSTPGGHLVLVEQEGEQKVLLTNTVYPLGDGPKEPKKPKYRLVGKRSPRFAVRVLAAHELPCQRTIARARLEPGGECSYFPPGFSTEGEVVVQGRDSIEGDFVVIGDDLVGSESEEGENEACLEEDEAGSGFFFEVGGVLAEEERRLQALEALGGSVAGLEERMTSQACWELLERELGNLPVAKRPMLQGGGRAVLLGLYGVGGFRGISKATHLYTSVTQWLNAFVRSQCPDHVWTTLYVSKNTRAPMHRDLRNAKGFEIWVRAVGEFSGGGLWIEGDSNQGCASRTIPGGGLRFGSVVDIKNEGVLFSGERWHASEEWSGDSRWVISAFTPRDIGAVPDEQWSLLEGLGFPIEGVRTKLSQGMLSRAAVQEVSEKVDGVWEVLWDVGIPLPVVDEGVKEGWIRKALYGLPTSPRDWGRYRDAEFTKFRLRWGEDEYHLVQTLSDDALWLARKATKTGYGNTEGILVVYVDDLAFLAPKGLGEAFVAAVQERWKTSTPEWFSERPLTFCGMELSQHGHGYRMSQSAYVRELLGRYGIEESSSTPITRWTEPEVGSTPSADEIKEAQAITGALLWLSTRTRPDLAYVVSRCGQQATKCPGLSVSLGKQALAYLRTTIDMGIEVPHSVGSAFSDHGLLSLPRTERVLELYTDASHSPCGGRSVQGIFLLWKGVPVTWESSRQSFVTLSSAEAELVTMIAGLQIAEAVLPLVQELIEQDVTISLLADNEAAIRAFDATPASWRSRHLRMRAFAARERISANVLRVTHMPGQYQIADIATKPLARARILQLLELVNIRSQFRVSESAKNARMLSRISLGGVPETGALAQTLAGLALLALLPRVQGQPAEDRLDARIEWLNWSLRFLIAGVALAWGWWWFFGSEVWQVLDEALGGLGEVLVSEEWLVLPSSDSVASDVIEPEDGSTNGAQGSGVCSTSRPEAEDPDDEFSVTEWAIVQAKFERMERESGLTFVQRARVRKAIAAGGILDPPIFQQRRGPLPAWLVGPDISTEVASYRSGDEGPGLPEVLEQCIGALIMLLGISAEEWLLLRETAPSVRNWVGLRRVRGFRELSSARSNQADSSAQFGGSPALSNQADSSAQFGGSPALSNPADSSAQFGGSSALSNPADSSAQFGGSSALSDQADSSAQFGGSQVMLGGSGLESQVDRSTRASVPQVQTGGSSSSTDPCPVPFHEGEVSIGVSSGSHGMVVHQDSWGPCYEDLVGIPEETAEFPWVGVWHRVHFVAYLLSEAGETLLGMLGERDVTWYLLRTTSNAVRSALMNAIVGGLRKGPYSVMFQGAQWWLAVEEYLLTGYPECDPAENWEGRSQGFPFVTWAPGITVHYLWRVFAIMGGRLLAFLGDRTSEWGRLRSAARGFHSHVLYAVLGWLRDTSVQRVADGRCSFEAADAYILSGVRTFPFEEREGIEDDADIDERPIRGLAWRPDPVLRLAPVAEALLASSSSSSADSEDTGSSTTDPSVGSLGVLSSSEDGREPQAEGLAQLPGPLPATAGLAYAAEDGCLVVTYVDDVNRVPLPGWTVEEVETIVQGLQTGDWSLFQEMMAESRDVSVEVHSGGVVQEPQGPRTWTGFQGFGFRGVFLVFWILFSFLKVAVAQGSGFLEVETQCSSSEEAFELAVIPAPLDVEDPREEQVYGCDGSTMWEIAKSFLIVLIWEASRRIWNRRFQGKTVLRDASCQTSEGGVVVLPLGSEVRCRSSILFCFWRAGLKVEVDAYPERIQSEFYHSVGAYLSRLEDGIVSESDSN